MERASKPVHQDSLASLSDLETYVPLRLAVFRRLKHAILEGALTPGMLLSENKLAADFAVSRTPVREALRVLEREGLVTVLPGRKVVVSVPSRQDIEEIYDIRLMVEAEAIRRIRPGDRQLFEKLDKCLGDSALALQKKDLQQLERINTAFHTTLVSALSNQRLRHFIDSLHDTAARLRGYSLTKKGWARKSVEEHKRLVSLLKKGQNEAAIRLLRRHLETGAKIVEGMFSGG